MDAIYENIKKGVQTVKTEAGKLTKAVIGKTNNIVDITKLNLVKTETEGKINKLYQQIGESVYDRYLSGTNPDGDISGICIEIDKFKNELKDLNEQLAEYKNTVACPECGQYNSKDSDYCSKCGSHISVKPQYAAPDVVDIVPDTENENHYE